MFKKLAVSAVAVVLLAASAGSAQGPWLCGADGSDLTCTLDEDGILTVSGTGAMKDYIAGAVSGGTAPWHCNLGCALNGVVIDEGVTYIGKFAFIDAINSGFTVTVSAETPPLVGEGAFSNLRMSSFILHVPQANIDAYRAADVWKDFGYINPSTVKFDLQGGIGDVDSQFLTYGGKATKPADPTREDYVFDGWAIEMSGGVPILWDFEVNTVTSDVTLIALWTSNTSVAHGVRPSSAAASRVTVRNRTLTVRPSSPESVSRVQLIDMRGKSVASFTARGAGSFSLGNIPAGRYFVEVREGARRERGSVVVGVR